MALHTDLQIHKTGCELLGLVADVQAALPRTFREYGNRIGHECTELLVTIAAANKVQGQARARLIEHIDVRLDVVKTMLKVAFEKKLIGHRLWSRCAQITGSLGKQAGGWLKSVRAPAA